MANRQVLKGGSPRSYSMKRVKVNKNMTFKQFSKLDSDGDGVPNSKDCRPFNAKKQGAIHDKWLEIKDKIAEARAKHAQKKEALAQIKRAESTPEFREHAVNLKLKKLQQEEKIMKLEAKEKKLRSELHPSFVEKVKRSDITKFVVKGAKAVGEEAKVGAKSVARDVL